MKKSKQKIKITTHAMLLFCLIGAGGGGGWCCCWLNSDRQTDTDRYQQTLKSISTATTIQRTIFFLLSQCLYYSMINWINHQLDLPSIFLSPPLPNYFVWRYRQWNKFFFNDLNCKKFLSFSLCILILILLLFKLWSSILNCQSTKLF